MHPPRSVYISLGTSGRVKLALIATASGSGYLKIGVGLALLSLFCILLLLMHQPGDFRLREIGADCNRIRLWLLENWSRSRLPFFILYTTPTIFLLHIWSEFRPSRTYTLRTLRDSLMN